MDCSASHWPVTAWLIPAPNISMQKCVSRWKNPQNRMCPWTGIRGQQKAMHAAKREERRDTGFELYYAHLLPAETASYVLTSRNWARWRGSKAPPSYSLCARLHRPTKRAIPVSSVPRAINRDNTSTGSKPFSSTPLQFVGHTSEHSKGYGPTYRPVEMWWHTRRNQISSFGETYESI